ncbi:sugar phosphate isomerase/epimerase family protein [Paenibacillus sp. 1001270B_150601_E10]|uniref:sugar phosphate isomerase/epimerase family protein n=1 Tax=Paenibacillus sp. 1001270B_150601_E10 TaxID=2787079 RepID=UPI00189F207D|nr:TIM barrel protein [Paenibacillus sp. 1001270B_150601_E10]
MQINIYKALWGMEGTYEEQFKRIAEAGYKGIEASLPSPKDSERFKALLQEHRLDFIALIATSGADHALSFAEQVERCLDFKPLLINAHSGKDSMTFRDQVAFFTQALMIEEQAGIPVAHETHRGRAMFTPWGTRNLIEELPSLKLTADFSHWCCVCESLLHDQEECLRFLFPHVIHIHARVGYAEGPQVPHPGAPEYAGELQAHEAWWEQIITTKRAAGYTAMSITPEYGPPGYMHTLPFTGQPVSDLWEVCLWMANRVEEQFRAPLENATSHQSG